MAKEEKSGLDRFRDLYLPTVREKADKFVDTLSYFAGPELTKLGSGILDITKLLMPLQNIPDASEFVEDPSLKNFGKLASDTGITALEMFPPTLIASKAGILPGKVAQEVVQTGTKSVKPISEIENFQSLIDKKGGKGKVIEVGEESTEGTFKYKGETYNKSDGVRLEYEPSVQQDGRVITPRSWMPKESLGGKTGVETGTKLSKLDLEVQKILSENFTNQELLSMRNKDLINFLENKGVVFTTKQPHITVGRARKELTGQTLKDVNITGPIKDEAEKVSRKIRSQLLNQFDSTGQNQINNFTDEMFNLTGFSKSSNDAMQINGIVARFLNGGLNAVKKGDATTEEIVEQLQKVDKEKLADILTKNNQIKNKLKQAQELGIDLDDLNLSHMEDVADNWKTSLDANNIFLATKKANQEIQKTLDSQLKVIFENFRNAKTLAEKKEIVQGFKDIKKQLEDNNLVSIIDGKKIGADIDFEKSFQNFSTEANEALNKRLFPSKKDGGIVSIFDMIQPINAQR